MRSVRLNMTIMILSKAASTRVEISSGRRPLFAISISLSLHGLWFSVQRAAKHRTICPVGFLSSKNRENALQSQVVADVSSRAGDSTVELQPALSVIKNDLP